MRCDPGTLPPLPPAPDCPTCGAVMRVDKPVLLVGHGKPRLSYNATCLECGAVRRGFA